MILLTEDEFSWMNFIPYLVSTPLVADLLEGRTWHLLSLSHTAMDAT